MLHYLLQLKNWQTDLEKYSKELKYEKNTFNITYNNKKEEEK